MRSNGVGWYYFNTITGDVKTDRSLMQKESSGMTRTVSEPHALNRADQAPSRRPSTGTSKSTRVLDMAEDALRVFGIKNKATRRASKASLGGGDRAYQTRHANVSIGDVDKRVSAGSIPTRSSSRLSGPSMPPKTEWSELERDRTVLQALVVDVQRHIDEAVRAAEQHLLALQAPETLTSLSLTTSEPDIPISQRPTALRLRESISILVPLIRQLVCATRHALVGLEQVIRATNPSPGALAYVSPEELHHPQRRLVAALSKVVFFTHSAAGTDWPLAGTAERLALDTRDLGTAVQAYMDEVSRIGCLRPGGKGLKSEARVVEDVPDGIALDEAAVVRCQTLVASLDSGDIAVLDQVYEFLCKLDVLAVLDVDDEVEQVPGWNEYAPSIAEAKSRFAEYSAAVRQVQEAAGDLILGISDRVIAAVQPLPSHLQSLLEISARQAEDVPPKLAHRVGASKRRSARSSLTSIHDFPSSLPQTMSRTGSIAGSRMSASSSVTSLSQDDYSYNYSRNSGTYGASKSFPLFAYKAHTLQNDPPRSIKRNSPRCSARMNSGKRSLRSSSPSTRSHITSRSTMPTTISSSTPMGPSRPGPCRLWWSG
jgi:hypothetical protein